MRALPNSVKQAVSHHRFNKDTYKEVLELADKVYCSTRPTGASVAAVSQPSLADDADQADPWPTQAQIEAMSPEVAAVYKVVRAAGGRGRGRGQANRGFRGGAGRGGRGGGRGGASAPSQATGQSSGQQYNAANPRHQGPRHQDLPPFSSCRKHWLFGKSAHWCMEPLTCPWKKFISPPSNNQN